jgi:hypothetical protein
MRVPGWCSQCQRIRKVQIGGAAMRAIEAVAAAGGRTPVGVCDECEQAEAKQAKAAGKNQPVSGRTGSAPPPPPQG